MFCLWWHNFFLFSLLIGSPLHVNKSANGLKGKEGGDEVVGITKCPPPPSTLDSRVFLCPRPSSLLSMHGHNSFLFLKKSTSEWMNATFLHSHSPIGIGTFK
jgi:hypothetical protein